MTVKKNKEQLLEWNRALGIDCSLKGVKLCKKHFDPKHILKLLSGRYRLHPNAFPLVKPFETEDSEESDSEHRTSKAEHSSGMKRISSFLEDCEESTEEGDTCDENQENYNEKQCHEEDEINSSLHHVTGDNFIEGQTRQETSLTTSNQNISDDLVSVSSFHINEEHNHLPGDFHVQDLENAYDSGRDDEFLGNTSLSGIYIKCDSDKSVKIVCGLPFLDSLGFLSEKYELLQPNVTNARSRIIMTMMMLKHNLSIDFLGIIFKINSKEISYIIKETIPVLSQILSPVIFWPEKNQKRILDKFKKFKNLKAIVASAEANGERPNCVNCQKSLLSDKNSSYIVKFLVSVAPCGTITCISDCVGGATDNHNITDFILKFKKGDAVMAEEKLLLEFIGNIN